jgi:hypothetical protein
MGSFARLQLVGRITYYVGWVSLLCGSAVHINIAKTMFLNIGLTQRNLFELSVVSFLICVASELRAVAGNGNQVGGASEVTPSVKKQMAA